MPQVLKDEVRQQIVAAALRVLSAVGYGPATMQAIAREAGTSVGNLYRYYPGKEAVFEAAVPEALRRRLRELVRARVRALDGVRDVGELPADAAWHLVSEELLDLVLDHRPAVVILLTRAGGSPCEAFAEELVDDLVRLAEGHAASVGARGLEDPAARAALATLYRSFVTTLAALLARPEDRDAVRATIAAYTRYHLAGVRALLDGAG